MPDPAIQQLLYATDAPPPPRAADPPPEAPTNRGPFAALLNETEDPGGVARLREARQRAAGIEGEAAGEYLARRSVPFFSSGIGVLEDQLYKESMARIASGGAGDGAFKFAAEYERRKELEAKKGTGGKILSALAGAPAVIGEVAATGGLATGAGRLAASGAAKLGAGELATGAASFAGRAAATAQLAPSFTLAEASRRSVEQGGSVADLKNLLPAAAHATLAAAVLGSIQKVALPVPTRVGRAVAQGAIGTVEQAGADTVAGLADEALAEGWKTKTRYGLAGEAARAFRGESNDFWGRAAVDMATFTAFALAHGKKPDSITDPFQLAADHLAKKGYSRDAAGSVLNNITGEFATQLKADPDVTQEWMKSRFAGVYPEGPLRNYADAIAEGLPTAAEVAARWPAGDQPGLPERAPSEPAAPPAAPEKPPSPRERLDALTQQRDALDQKVADAQRAARGLAGTNQEAAARKELAASVGRRKALQRELDTARDAVLREPTVPESPQNAPESAIAPGAPEARPTPESPPADAVGVPAAPELAGGETGPARTPGGAAALGRGLLPSAPAPEPSLAHRAQGEPVVAATAEPTAASVRLGAPESGGKTARGDALTRHALLDAAGREIGEAKVFQSGGTLNVDWIGLSGKGGTSREAKGALGTRDLLRLVPQLAAAYPDAVLAKYTPAEGRIKAGETKYIDLEKVRARAAGEAAGVPATAPPEPPRPPTAVERLRAAQAARQQVAAPRPVSEVGRVPPAPEPPKKWFPTKESIEGGRALMVRAGAVRVAERERAARREAMGEAAPGGVTEYEARYGRQPTAEDAELAREAAADLLSRAARRVEVGVAARPRPEPKPGRSLRRAVLSHGGIDPAGGEFLNHFSGVTEAAASGVPRGLFRYQSKGGRDLGALAREMQGNGHLQVPEGEDPAAYLLDLISSGKESLRVTEDSAYQADQLARHQEREMRDAEEAAKAGFPAARVEEGRLVGEGEAAVEFASGREARPTPGSEPARGAPGEPLRPLGEPADAAGPAGEFEFGHNEPGAGGPAARGPADPAAGDEPLVGSRGRNLLGEPLPPEFRTKKSAQPTIEDAYRETRTEREAVGEAFPPPPEPDASRGGVPGTPGGGPAVPGRDPGREFALAREAVTGERSARNRGAVALALRRSNPRAWAEAVATLRADPEAGAKLVDRLEADPHLHADADVPLLLQRRVALSNAHDSAAAEYLAAAQNAALGRVVSGATPAADISRVQIGVAADSSLEPLRRRVEDLAAGRDRLDRVTAAVGTQLGRGLQFFRQLAREDYSLGAMLRQARVAKGGKPLTPEEEQTVARQHEAVRQADERLAEFEAGTPTDNRRGDAADARIAARTARAEFAGTLGDLKRAGQTRGRRALGLAGELVGGVSRVFITAYDLSAVFRQGGILTAAHPIKAATAAAPEMFRSLVSERDFQRAQDALQQRPNALLYKRAKLFLADVAGPLAAQEEAFMGRLVRKIPGVKQSERAYTAYLNRVRADVFDSLAASARSGKPTDAESKALANFVNVATGRGPLGSLEKAATVMAQVFFSPRYAVSRFQVLAGQPFYGGSWRTRGLVASEYARALGGLAVFYGVMSLANRDSEITFDPRSADFGKVKVGRTRIDPLTGLAQAAVFVSRLVSGETKSTETQKVSPLRGPKVPYGGQTVGDVVGRFLRSKLAPVPGVVMDALTGKGVVGEPVTPLKEAGQVAVPISVRDVYDALREQGFPRGVAASLLAILGMGTQVYEPRVKRAG